MIWRVLACSGLLALGCTPDADGDGFPADVDCDDAAAEVFPGADERCNGVDDDCDGTIDEEPTDAPPAFVDADGDGFGSATLAPSSCTPADGTASTDDDCDDTRDDVFPDAPEVCHDGAVNDCLATEPPDCPLSGEIPISIALARRPIDTLDYSALQLLPRPDGDLPQTMVRSSRGEVVNLGPVIGGAATAFSARTLIEDADGCAVVDSDLDDDPELLCARPSSGLFVVEPPLADGIVSRASEADLGTSTRWVIDAGDVGTSSVALRGDDVMQLFPLPLDAGQRAAWTYTPAPGVRPRGWTHQSGPESDYWVVPFSDDSVGSGADLVEVTTDGPRRRLRVLRSSATNIQALRLLPLLDEASPRPIVWTRTSPPKMVVFDSDATGEWSIDDEGLEHIELTAGEAFVGTHDIDGDGSLDTLQTSGGLVRLPIKDGDLTPFAWFEAGINPTDLHFHDLDDDGHPEWIFIGEGRGEDGKVHGITVLPGNWP